MTSEAEQTTAVARKQKTKKVGNNKLTTFHMFRFALCLLTRLFNLLFFNKFELQQIFGFVTMFLFFSRRAHTLIVPDHC